MIDDVLKTFGLARAARNPLAMPGARETLEVTSKAIRVNPVELEKAYLRHPIVFNGVNAYLNVFLSTNYYLSGDQDDVDDLNAFLSKIDWQSKLINIVSRQAIYGKAWLELRNGSRSGKLVDVATVDPKTMDFKRDLYGNIVYDSANGGPSSYFQYLSYDVSNVSGKDVKMQTSPWEGGDNRGIDIPKEKIALYPLYTSSNDFDGVGLIEPVYDVVKSSNTFRKGLSQYIVRHGFPITATYVGDANHEPTMEEIDHVVDLMKNLNEKNEIVVPYYYRVEVLESKKAIQLSQHLEYFDDLIIAGMGVPRAFVLGAGEGLNKSTLDKQNLMFMRKIKMMQHAISQITREMIFKRYANENGFNTVPELLWEEVSLDDMDSKAQRISQYIQVQALTPDDSLEAFIRSLEHLPPMKEGRKIEEKISDVEKKLSDKIESRMFTQEQVVLKELARQKEKDDLDADFKRKKRELMSKMLSDMNGGADDTQ
jgi:hypothetical protein